VIPAAVAGSVEVAVGCLLEETELEELLGSPSDANNGPLPLIEQEDCPARVSLRFGDHALFQIL
jgi:hypothetical protein